MWILKISSFTIHFPLATTSDTVFLFQKCVPTEPGKNRKVAGYTKLIKILVAKTPDHSTKTLASQGLLNIELCKLPSLVKCSKNVLNYHESKLHEKQVRNVFCFSYQKLDVSRYYAAGSL